MHTPCDCSLWWWGVARASTQLAVAKLLRRFRYVCLACLALYLSTYSPPLHPILFDQPSYPSATWGHTIHTFLIKLTIGRCKLLWCLPGPLSVHMYSPYPSTPYQTISRTSLVTQFPHFSSHWPAVPHWEWKHNSYIHTNTRRRSSSAKCKRTTDREQLQRFVTC